MTYAILGSGNIGSAIARQFARENISVLIANQSGPESMKELAKELGSSIVASPMKDALLADVVILAIPFTAVPEATKGVAWGGRIVVDATNAIDFPAFTPTDLGGRPSSEVIADAVPGARVVKAFNTLPAAVLAKDPAEGGARRVLWVSSNDAKASAEVAELIDRLGYFPVQLGRIAEGGLLQQFAGPLTVHSLMKQPDSPG
jgi:predicted dinucleotide-binding enzyme